MLKPISQQTTTTVGCRFEPRTRTSMKVKQIRSDLDGGRGGAASFQMRVIKRQGCGRRSENRCVWEGRRGSGRWDEGKGVEGHRFRGLGGPLPASVPLWDSSSLSHFLSSDAFPFLHPWMEKQKLNIGRPYPRTFSQEKDEKKATIWARKQLCLCVPRRNLQLGDFSILLKDSTLNLWSVQILTTC